MAMTRGKKRLDPTLDFEAPAGDELLEDDVVASASSRQKGGRPGGSKKQKIEVSLLSDDDVAGTFTTVRDRPRKKESTFISLLSDDNEPAQSISPRQDRRKKQDKFMSLLSDHDTPQQFIDTLESPQPRQRKKRQTVRVLDRDQLAESREALKNGELPAWNELKDPLTIESDPMLRNLAAWNRVSESLHVTVQHQPVSFQATAIDELLELPQTNDFRFETTKKTRRDLDSYQIILQSNVSSKTLQIGCTHSNGWIDQDDIARHGPLMARLVNHYPHDFEKVKINSQQSACLQDLAMAVRNTRRMRFFKAVRHRDAEPKRAEGYSIELNFIDPTTGKIESLHKDLTLKTILDLQPVPDTPLNCFFSKKMGVRNKAAKELPGSVAGGEEGNEDDAGEGVETGEDGDELGNDRASMFNVIPSDVVDGEERSRHEMAIKILRLVSLIWSNKCIAKADLKRASKAFVAQYQSNMSRGAKAGPYNGNKLVRYTMRRSGLANRRYAVLELCEAAQKDVTGSWPKVYVDTHDTNWIAPCLDATNQCYVSTGNLKKAWKVNCKTADAINGLLNAGEAPQSFCQCTAQMSATTSHPCGKCLNLDLCSRLRQLDDYILPICAQCMKELEDGVDRYAYRITRDKQAGYMLSRKLARSYIRDDLTTQRELDDDVSDGEFEATVKKAIEEALAEYDKYFPTKQTFRDGYTDIVTDIHQDDAIASTAGKKCAKFPFSPSPDAIMPYIIYKGKVTVHALGNILPTAQCLNYMKYTWIPATLEIIGEYVRSSQDESARRKVVDMMDDVCDVAMQNEHEKAARMGKKADGKVYAQDKEAWVKGRPIDAVLGKPHQGEYAAGLDFDTVTRTYTPPDKDAFLLIVEEIENKFKKTFRRAKDGCPYPFEDEMPKSWSWAAAQSLFYDRAVRCFLYCNGRWIQRDTPKTIFLECLYQAADPDFKGILNLPLAIRLRHPLRFVVAHIRHGEELRSGWTKLNPTSLSDRDPKLNNMSIETAAENYFKHNYDAAHYPAMIKYAGAIKVPKSMYDPEL